MEHGAEQCIKEQPHKEMTTAIGVQSTPYVDTESTATNTKEEPGLMEPVKREPGLLVKEEVVEDSWRDIEERQRVQEAAAIVGSTNVLASSADLDKILNIKEELGAIDIELTVHMDTPYTTNQPDTSVVKQESTNNGNNGNPIPCGGVNEATIEDECRGSELRNYVCDNCQKTYKSKDDLQIHFARVHANRPYKCSQCNKSFNRKGNLNRHTATVHSAGVEECNVCGKSLRASYQRRHMFKMHREQLVHCKLCAEVMMSKQRLRQHLIDCHGQQSADVQHSEETQPDQRAQLYRCDKCPKTFKRNDSLQTHCTRVHATGSHECTECHLKFKCAEYLVRHLRHVHSKVQHECAGCKKMCKSKDALRRHVTWCHESRSAGSPQQFTCSNCGKNFKTKWYCLRHEQSGKCTRPTASNTCAVASTSTLQHSVVMVKEEPADGELELGPVVFQHMDSNYRPYKQESQLD